LKNLPAIGVVLALSGLFFFKMDAPFLPIFLLWAIGGSLLALRMKSRAAKIIFLNVAVISSLLFTVELGGTLLEEFRRPPPGPPYRQDYRGDSRSEHSVLGSGPKAGSSYQVVKTRGDEVLYDVVYNFGEDGLRVGPDSEENESRAILFFGGSLTLGEGVNDSEAFPYLIGQETGFRTLNFGFHGYGPHQMLAALQSGLAEEKLGQSIPTHVIYLGLPGHARRCAGLVPWNGDQEPYFQLESKGRVKQCGRFGLPSSFLENMKFKTRRLLTEKLRRSFLGRRLVFTTEADLDRWAGIVNESRIAVEKRWPEARFHAMVINGDSRYKDRLDELGVWNSIPFDVAPHLEREGNVIEGDGHPSVLGHRMLAQYVLEYLLKKEPRGDEILNAEENKRADERP
jgi:hypothetical protein